MAGPFVFALMLLAIAALSLSAIAKSQGYRQDERDYRETPSAEVSS